MKGKCVNDLQISSSVWRSLPPFYLTLSALCELLGHSQLRLISDFPAKRLNYWHINVNPKPLESSISGNTNLDTPTFKDYCI